MGKKLVAYFSATGTTADAAKKIAEAAGADLYEIRPETPYTTEDLDWNNQSSRTSLEMNMRSLHPALADTNANVGDYDIVFLGFPIWWYTVPTIINAFLESYDFSGKKIILFGTSGSTGFDKVTHDIEASVNDTTELVKGVIIHGTQSAEEWKSWVDGLEL